MVPIHDDDLFVFVIDTDKYAGNFERQMCAYMTGIYGECEVGKQEANIFDKETEGPTADTLEGLVINQTDEHGCRRPVTIVQSHHAAVYNSVGIFMAEKPNAKELALLVQRAHKFVSQHVKQHSDPQNNIKILGFRFLIKKTQINTDSQWDAAGETA